MCGAACGGSLNVGTCVPDGSGVLPGVAGAWAYAHVWTCAGYMELHQDRVCCAHTSARLHPWARPLSSFARSLWLGPLCLPVWETIGPRLWTEQGTQVAEKES